MNNETLLHLQKFEIRWSGISAFAAKEITMADTYRIVRSYFRGGKKLVDTGLTLEEAQTHCKDPDTSSRTATSSAAKRRTAKRGPWFDGYEKE